MKTHSKNIPQYLEQFNNIFFIFSIYRKQGIDLSTSPRIDLRNIGYQTALQFMYEDGRSAHQIYEMWSRMAIMCGQNPPSFRVVEKWFNDFKKRRKSEEGSTSKMHNS